MIKRAEIALGVMVLLLIATAFLQFFSDWAVDLFGEKEKVLVIKFAIFIISIILMIFGITASVMEIVERVKNLKALAVDNRWTKKQLIRTVTKLLRKKMETIGQVIWKILVFGFLFVMGMVSLVLFILLILVIFNEYVEYWAEGILDSDRKRDTIQFIGWGIAGMVAIFGAVAVSRRANAQVKNNELVERGHIQERFRAAVGHLGSEHEGARIASFYELSYLASDNKDLRRNIFDILCAHLRQVTASDKYDPKRKFIDNKENSKGIKPTEEVQSLLDVLSQLKDNQEESIFVEFKANLRGIFLVKASLQRTNLQDANLDEANLRGANLYRTNLRDASLFGADFREAGFLGTNLENAWLNNGKFQGAWFYEVNFRKADLWGVNLEDVDLREADLQGADLRGANLRGADLRRVKNLETANLSRAKIKGVKFPEGYKPPPDADTTSDD